MKQTSGNSGTRKTRSAGGSAAVRMALMRNDPADMSERMEHIATAAYYRAEARGFEPGHELEDWFAAEAEMMEPGKGNGGMQR